MILMIDCIDENFYWSFNVYLLACFLEFCWYFQVCFLKGCDVTIIFNYEYVMNGENCFIFQKLCDTSINCIVIPKFIK